MEHEHRSKFANEKHPSITGGIVKEINAHRWVSEAPLLLIITLMRLRDAYVQGRQLEGNKISILIFSGRNGQVLRHPQ